MTERTTPRGPSVNRITTVASLGIVLVFAIGGAVWSTEAQAVFDAVQARMLHALKWYYVAIVAFVLAFVLWLGFGRYKNVRLGGDEERPEFTYFSWFSMLFAAGMGIGLIFWSIAEPLSHYQANPFAAEGETAAAASTAMRLAFFHWGLNAWAVYALVALALAYFAYRRDEPLTLRSTLRGAIGPAADGWAGHAVDVITVFGTAFGVATSLGLGVQQIDGGVSFLIGGAEGRSREIWILAGITIVATISAASGVRRGVRVLSNMNLVLSFMALLFFFGFGPTRHLLNLLVETTGSYLQNLPRLSTWTDAQEHSGWQEQWTVFYWGWWIAWSPFVGMFIARISRGRSIREFVMGVLLVPTILTFVWLTLTGGTALYLEVFEGRDLLTPLGRDITLPLYRTIELLDGGVVGRVAAGLMVVLVATYFVTSCDSGTLVIATILSDGADEPPMALRVVWGLCEGALAAVLLLVGGVAALQAAVVIAGLPVALILLMIMVGLVRVLREEPAAPREGLKTRADCEPWTGCAC